MSNLVITTSKPQVPARSDSAGNSRVLGTDGEPLHHLSPTCQFITGNRAHTGRWEGLAWPASGLSAAVCQARHTSKTMATQRDQSKANRLMERKPSRCHLAPFAERPHQDKQRRAGGVGVGGYERSDQSLQLLSINQKMVW